MHGIQFSKPKNRQLSLPILPLQDLLKYFRNSKFLRREDVPGRLPLAFVSFAFQVNTACVSIIAIRPATTRIVACV